MNSLRTRAAVVPCIMLLCLSASSIASAYNPPADAAGPLRLRIDGPEIVTQIGTPFDIAVHVRNAGERPVSGEIKLAVIDTWSVQPGQPIAFQVPSHGRIQKSFRVTPGAGSYNAHYPIHAFVDFKDGGKAFSAHPILIVETKFADMPRPSAPLPWKPLRMAKNSSLSLWQTPVRRTIVQVFGEEPIVMPVGISGAELRSRADAHVGEETLSGRTRSVIVTHPPWDQGHVGTIAVEYPLVLPPDQPIELRFANAMSVSGQSDGVTFRVRVARWDAPDGELGDVVFERHVTAKTWQEARVDLSKYSGQQVRLQLESHPGPKKNTGWDRSFWAEPTLAAGTPPPPAPFPPVDDHGSQLLGTTRCDGASYEVRLWPGPRGLLDAAVGLEQDNQSLYWRGFEVTILGARVDQPGSPMRLARVAREEAGGGVQVRHSFDGPFGSFDLVGWIGIEQSVLRVRFHLENAPDPRPWRDLHIENIAISQWSRPVRRLYAGAGNVLCEPGAYRLNFDGHRLATSFVGYDFGDGFSLIEATDVPPLYLDVRPDRKHASLHASDTQTRTLIPTGNVWKGVRQWREANGLRAAGGVRKAAGRFVFDLWGGKYGASTADLKKAFRYGLTDSMVIWHNWQRWGYDYRLPEIYPPNPRYGTEQELRAMVDACRAAGVLFALHDNYIDYYPDADGFSYQKKIAFHQNGTPVRAWLNKGRAAQSYRYRSDAAETVLKANLELIKNSLNPSAYFIDVWSSTRPYDYWTADGTYVSSLYSRQTWRNLFSWIRDHLGDNAPQISESGHDQLIGWLDGAQANHLRVGKPIPGQYSWSVWNWPCTDAERTPWYDAAHHDRFILHGAGYEARYASGLDVRLHGMYSDDYISTEMLTGRPAMVSRPFGRDVVRKYWLTHDVMRALAMRTIETVEFVDGDIHRQHVRWSGGGEVWVNRGSRDWRVKEFTLPEYGFLAVIPTKQGDVVATISRRDGLVVESAVAAAQQYYNARSLRRHNPEDREINFGPVTTSGGCRLTRAGQQLLVTLLPGQRGQPFTLRIDYRRLGWSLKPPTKVEVIGIDGRVIRREPVQREGDVVTLKGSTDVFGYRLIP